MHRVGNGDATDNTGVPGGNARTRGVPAPVVRRRAYHDAMSSSDENEQPSVPSSATPVQPLASPRRARWVVGITAAIALIALGLAAWPLLRPLHASTAASATDGQVAAAKVHVCNDFDTVRRAVSLQTHANAGNDAAAVQATAANARLALAAGGSYLVARLDPATSPALATAIRSFGDNLQEIAMNTLAGAGNDDPAQAARLHDGEALSEQINDLCK
jgi:hypothetical protein